MKRLSLFRIGAVLVFLFLLGTTPVLAQGRIGGYVYNGGEDRFVRNVWGFLKHFNYTQYYWNQAYMYTSHAYAYVDYVNIAYYSGHGNYYYIGMGPSAAVSGVNLRTAGTNNDNWGRNLRFIIFQSCQVIPTVPEMNAGKIANWWSAWVPNGIFDGVHQAIGYRTLSYSDNGISSNFGSRVKAGNPMWQSWFKAVDAERSWWKGKNYPGYASAVMHPSHQWDTAYSFGTRPPKAHSNLYTYWQY
jgi:hypothetical protein